MEMENDAGYFPLFVSLQGKKILIVGAGKIAARRATVLVEFGALVTVVAPEADSEEKLEKEQPEKNGNPELTCKTVSVTKLEESDRLIWKRHPFGAQDIKDLEESFLVIAATDDPAVNDDVVRLCRKRGIPVNHAGDQSQCDFQFPAIVRKDPVVIGVNAGGKDHGLVKRVAAGLRAWIEHSL